jgi:hypothetical protein
MRSHSQEHSPVGCYAIHLGDCKGRMSKEHYISRSVLKIAGKIVQVSGFPWQKPDEPQEVGIHALTSKILCSHHNSQLSPLDETGKEFLSALKSIFDEALANENYAHEDFSIDGNKLELWLLKILCGVFVVSGTVKVPERWIEILFQREPFAEGSGMHIFGAPGSAGWFFNLVRIISVGNKSGKISGAKFGIGGLAFLLAFGKPQFSEEGVQSFYRPRRIVIQKEANEKRLGFLWPHGEGTGSVHLQVVASIEESPKGVKPKYRPIVAPNGDV